MTGITDLAWRLGYRAAHLVLRCWWRLRRPAAEGAGVAVWCRGRLLVVRSSYRRALDLPGGGVEPGEGARLAALRELREEVGLDAPAEDLREAARLAFEQEGRRITDTIFEWQACRCDPPRIDRREIVWAGWLTPAELRAHELGPALAMYLSQRSDSERQDASPLA